MEDAAGSVNALHGNFRSPVLDYYLWLDHTPSGFYTECCWALQKSHGVTFEGLHNFTCSDILKFYVCLSIIQELTALIYDTVDWCSYHNKECKEHDYYGALQGCRGGKDIEHLLYAVDNSLNDPNPTVDPEGGTQSVGSINMDDVVASIETELNTEWTDDSDISFISHSLTISIRLAIGHHID